MAYIQLSPNSNGCSGPSAPIPSKTNNSTSGCCNNIIIPIELHACMGLNACKGHDKNGTNICAGMGVCATAQTHVCHTLNNCRNQGGCGLYGDAEEQMNPGNNRCASLGSCAVPIQAERFSTMGPNAGKSVWLRARAIFEERMKQADRSFGASPMAGGPSQAWLTSQLGQYDSCGNAGNKYCSFGFNDPNENGKKLREGKDILVDEKYSVTPAKVQHTSNKKRTTKK